MAGTGRTFDDETAGTAALLLKKLNKGPKPQGNVQQQQAGSSQQAQTQPQPTSANHGADPRTSTGEADSAANQQRPSQQRPSEGDPSGAREGGPSGKREGGSSGARPANQQRAREGGPSGARDDDQEGARIGNRAARDDLPRASWLLKVLLTMTAVLILFPAAIWCLTVDAPHSPQALSRPIVTWTVGGSRVAAVIAPFISAATYSSYLYAFLRRSLNETLPAILSPIDPAGIAKLNVSADKLRTEMLSDADARWRHLQEIDEYIFTDIESAWFFQRGDWDLILRLFPRRAVYYASLWAGVPSPEPPMRTARRRVSELQAFLEHGVAANDALLWKAIATRLTYLQRMESAVQKYNVMLRRDGRADQPRDANREQRDAEAVTKVIQDLLHRAAENSTAADQQFTREPDVFKAMVWELKQKKASLSPNNAVFEGSWGLVFENGARALEVLVRLEELTGALRWLLADVEEPKGKLG